MEELEYVPGHYVVNQIIRPHLACTCCEAVVQAPMPSRPIFPQELCWPRADGARPGQQIRLPSAAVSPELDV